ncbi:MAG TPA: aromatic amino acid transaminase [Novosphingobium sp.]|nr:aromatic amino acid transaminase [Novosphingobium sp.]
MPFPDLLPQPADPLLALARSARQDTRPARLDLSVGVYRAASGHTPVMQAVKAAELALWREQASKAYLGVEGDPAFLEAIGALALGRPQPDLLAMQTPGGTGALRLAADLLKAGKADRQIWIGTPSWSNHVPVMAAAGLHTRCFAQFDVARQKLLPEALLEAIAQAAPGDAVLLQPFCHNPTGAGLSPAQIVAAGQMIAARGLVALVDVAYHGFGGALAEDAALLALLLDQLPEALVAYSCSKNFGLYRERVGALLAHSTHAPQRALMAGNLQALARANYSMPPAHGAAIVAAILHDPQLEAQWRDELAGMALRLRETRAALGAAGVAGAVDLSAIPAQSGMFSLLDLPRGLAQALRRDHAIYVPESGRINIAGLDASQVPAFVAALRACQARAPALHGSVER